MDTDITLTEEGGKLVLATPYHPKLPTRARDLGGKWSAAKKVWTFDVRDRQRVESMVLSIYGVDLTSESPPELATLRVKLGVTWEQNAEQKWVRHGIDDSGPELWLCGRLIVSRTGRDARAVLGDGVVVITGGFPSSGGSRNHPSIDAREGTVLEVRDVPLVLAEREQEKNPEGIEIIDEQEPEPEEPEPEDQDNLGIEQLMRRLKDRLHAEQWDALVDHLKELDR